MQQSPFPIVVSGCSISNRSLSARSPLPLRFALPGTVLVAHLAVMGSYSPPKLIPRAYPAEGGGELGPFSDPVRRGSLARALLPLASPPGPFSCYPSPPTQPKPDHAGLAYAPALLRCGRSCLVLFLALLAALWRLSFSRPAFAPVPPRPALVLAFLVEFLASCLFSPAVLLSSGRVPEYGWRAS